MKSIWFTLVLLLIVNNFVGPTVVAQETFLGLHFGMPKGLAQSFLQSKGYTLLPASSGDTSSFTGFDVHPSSMKVALPVVIRTHFDKVGLTKVDLMLDSQSFTKQYPPPPGNDLGSAVVLVGPAITDDLIKKYGAAVDQSNSCGTALDDYTAGARASCQMTWTTVNQSIVLYWATGVGASLTITYAAHSSEL